MEKEIFKLLLEGRKIEAETMLFQQIGNLSEAKKRIAEIETAMPVFQPYRESIEDLITFAEQGRIVKLAKTIQELGKENQTFTNNEELIEATFHFLQLWQNENSEKSDKDFNLEKNVLALLLEGKKIHAVKLVKENTNLGLKESKDLVDAFE